MKDKVIRLFGGHRNKVFRIDGKVKIVWKDGFKRQKQIREGVLLENFVAVHTYIKSRMLVDKSKPVQEESGKLVTYFRYAEGEIRYPWNLEEIVSAAKLLARFHSCLEDRPLRERTVLSRQLHLDFARGNVLFRPGSVDAIGVIDFETTAKGSIEQELGRSLSFILVDTPQGSSFLERWNFFLTNYSLPFRKDKVINWTLRYLTDGDYGDLNFIRNKVVLWLRDNNLTI